jgi:hypothetical protein
MKLAYALFGLLLLTACGTGGPPPPDWKADSADLIERYKKYALDGDNVLAERYFQQALMATGGAGRIADTARLWLVHCATRRASLIDDDCHAYADLARFETSPEDHAYYQLLTLDWHGLDPARLPRAYSALVRAAPAELNTDLRAITDPLSRLLAASLIVQRGQADATTLAIAADTASAQGWRQPLLVYLKLLEQHAVRAGDTIAQQHYAMQIKLIENALKSEASKSVPVD